MKLVAVFVFFCSILACSNKKAKHIDESSVNEIKEIVVRADSINEEFLSRAVYDTALFYNNSPDFEGEFLLNEKKFMYELSGLGKSFTDEEKLMPIPIREVTWKINVKDFITVFYAEKNDVFVPVDVMVYDLSTRW